jgi:homoserine O-succinyltransferase
VLTRTTDAEVDTFIKRRRALFLFFQGHPEYESDTLMREYRRDIGRYFKRETTQYPLMPHNYFDRDTVDALDALRLRSASGQGEELVPEISAVLSNANIKNTWQSSATSIYTNWLLYIGTQKEKAARSKRAKAVASAPQVRWASAVLDAATEA